jgi:hypothetical protein
LPRKSGGEPGACNALTHDIGFEFSQCADHSETMKRWAGRLQEAFGSNM